MIDTDYTFGTTTFACDECGNEEEFEGFDGKVDVGGAAKEAKEGGWKIIYVNGDWEHYCPSHNE